MSLIPLSHLLLITADNWVSFPGLSGGGSSFEFVFGTEQERSDFLVAFPVPGTSVELPHGEANLTSYKEGGHAGCWTLIISWSLYKQYPAKVINKDKAVISAKTLGILKEDARCRNCAKPLH